MPLPSCFASQVGLVCQREGEIVTGDVFPPDGLYDEKQPRGRTRQRCANFEAGNGRRRVGPPVVGAFT